MSPSLITSHVLDTSLGRPASGVPISLYFQDPSTQNFQFIGKDITNEDGRVHALVSNEQVLQPGVYRVIFNTAAYFSKIGQKEYFYPEVTITFHIKDIQQHYHIPLLLNPFGFSSYRGS